MLALWCAVEYEFAPFASAQPIHHLQLFVALAASVTVFSTCIDSPVELLFIATCGIIIPPPLSFHNVQVRLAYHLQLITPIRLDLSEPVSIAAAAKEASDVEVVINNAGVLTVSNPLEDSAISNLEYEMAVTYTVSCTWLRPLHLSSRPTAVVFSCS